MKFTVCISILWATLYVAAPLHAQEIASKKSSSEPSYPHSSAYYYQGHSKVKVHLALDEFHVQGVKEHGVNLSGINPKSVVSSHTDRSALVRLESKGLSYAQLNARAQAFTSQTQDVFGVVYPKGQSKRSSENRQVVTNRMAVKCYPDVSIESLAVLYGFEVLRSVPYDSDTYIVKMDSDDLLLGLDIANTLYEANEVVYAEPVIQRKQSLRYIPNDPLFSSQWHLNNTGLASGFVAGNDANIMETWDTVTGDGINILIVDDGIAVDHEDLAPNARTDLDYDYFDDDDSPLPGSWHGSASSGIALARGGNSKGVIGAAFEASLVGIRLLGGAFTVEQEADAMSHLVGEENPADFAYINSNSWGPTDHPSSKASLSSVVASALAGGALNGRNGKGVVYVWAGGNGRGSDDRATYDPYTSSRYTIAVGASGGEGIYSEYSEPGPCLLVNAPSGLKLSGSYGTTSTNTSGYTSDFGGTSSAAPLVAGVIALMLQSNFDLGWRDVQQILVETSTETDLKDPEWFTNGAGHLYNENYGFGRINAEAAVEAASSWTNLPATLTPLSEEETGLSVSIPDNNLTGLTRSLVVNSGGSFSIEHVDLTVDITHTYRGDLEISLTSPSGMKSIFTKTHFAEEDEDYSNWTFTSVAHWGEDPNGTWTLKVIDGADVDVGTLNRWSIDLHGTTPVVTIPTSSGVYVDKDYLGYEQGTSLSPFNTLSEAIAHLTSGGNLYLYPGVYDRATSLNFDSPMTFDGANSGTASIE